MSRLKWSDRGGGYVRARFAKAVGGDGGFVYLHRFIMRAPPGVDVDHMDGNPLNNTRENLQIVTRSRNIMRTQRGGVTRARNKWRARIRVDGIVVNLGCFVTEEAARREVERARRIVWENPRINVMDAKL